MHFGGEGTDAAAASVVRKLNCRFLFAGLPPLGQSGLEANSGAACAGIAHIALGKNFPIDPSWGLDAVEWSRQEIAPLSTGQARGKLLAPRADVGKTRSGDVCRGRHGSAPLCSQHPERQPAVFQKWRAPRSWSAPPWPRLASLVFTGSPAINTPCIAPPAGAVYANTPLPGGPGSQGWRKFDDTAKCRPDRGAVRALHAVHAAHAVPGRGLGGWARAAS